MNRRNRHLYLISVINYLIVLQMYVSAQSTIRFDRLTSEQIRIEKGLSQNTIFSILQDSRGFLWFGTWDGLNKFDGAEYQIFRPAIYDTMTSLSNKSVFSLFEDENRQIWAGTQLGVNCFNPRTGVFKAWKKEARNPASLSSDTVTCFASAGKGDIWIGTFHGLNKYSRATGRISRSVSNALLQHSIHRKNILKLHAVDSKLWFATPEGMYLYEPNFDHLHFWPIPGSAPGKDNPVINTFIPKGLDAFWVATTQGLYLFEPDYNRWKFQKFNGNPTQISGNIDIAALCMDHNGMLWLGTRGQGLLRYTIQHQAIEQFINQPDDPYSLSNDFISVLFEDRSGILWVGTSWNGVNKIVPNKSQFRHIFPVSNDNKSLNNNLIWTFLEKSPDEFWIGTEDGINCYHKSSRTFTYIRKQPEGSNCLASNKIRKFFKDSRGDIWIATDNEGLSRFKGGNPNNCTLFTHIPGNPFSIPVNGILDIEEDTSGYLWMATRGGGLCRYNPATGQFYSYKHRAGLRNSLSSNTVWSVFIDKRQRIWLGTSNGMSLFIPSTQQFRVFRHEPGNLNSLSSNDVFDVVEDKKGILWIGTSGGGLNRFDPVREQFSVFSELDGLANNVIYNILIDESSLLWMSTNYGISCFDPLNQLFYNYDVRDGVQSNEFNYGAALRTTSGEMFFGGMNGYNHFFPRLIRKNNYIPEARVTRFKILNTPIPYTLDNGDTLELRHNENFFTLGFAALDYTNPSRNRHKYMLEGIDNEWILAEVDRHQVSYTDLKQGHYRFRLMGSNNDGVWSEKEFVLHIIIHPAWYESWWFRALAILLTGMAAWFLISRRIRKIKQKHGIEKKLLTLENQVLDIERKALQLQMNPHFIFNAMNSIQGFILENDTDKAIYYLSRFSHLMRLILNNSRESYVLLSSELKAIEYYVELERLRFDNRFSFTLELSPGIDPEHIEIPPMLIQPYLENSIIHGFNGFTGEGKIQLNVHFQEGLIHIQLQDNGIGRSRSKELQESMGLKRNSMGMFITAKRLELLKKNRSDRFSIRITDLYDADHQASGTRVDIELVPRILREKS